MRALQRNLQQNIQSLKLNLQEFTSYISLFTCIFIL